MTGTLAWLTLALVPGATAQESARALTYADDVAPILERRCVPCHSPGQAAPFALRSFEDVERRATLVADVVARRLMPPWLPVEGHGGPFVGERRLSEVERAMLLAWIEAGRLPGDLTKVPPPPPARGEWELGPPDLVLTLTPPCEVPPEGRDVYRNFVIPVPVSAPRFVRALAFEPGNRAVLHHASIGVDASGTARALDARDPEPGFPGMGMGGARLPDGHFLGWAPGKSTDEGREDLAWRLAPGEDLVLQMHLRPTGRTETIQPRIGLYFTERAPSKRPVAIVLSAFDLDIPAGAKDYVSERAYRLPVAAEVLALYPHAHYLGKELRAWAELPDGSTRALIRLEPWDFSWQDSYRYVEPVALPAGARLRFRYSYDNSAENPLNPSSPPRRVVYGESSTDEMAELLVQLLPASPAARETLERDFARHLDRETLAHLEGLWARSPSDQRLLFSIGLAHERLGEYPAALERLRALTTQRPRDAMARATLGRVLARAGDLATAESELTLAQQHLGGDGRTRQTLAAAWRLLGEAARSAGDAPRAGRALAAAQALAER